jgi:hypothetical protein
LTYLERYYTLCIEENDREWDGYDEGLKEKWEDELFYMIRDIKYCIEKEIVK